MICIGDSTPSLNGVHPSGGISATESSSSCIKILFSEDGKLVLSKTQIESIAKATDGQHDKDNRFWSSTRKYRLTALSFLKALQVAKKPNPKLIKYLKSDLARSNDNYRSDTEYNSRLEEAIDMYKNYMLNVKEVVVQVEETGIWLFPNGLLGASPERLVYFGEGPPGRHVPDGVLEVVKYEDPKCAMPMTFGQMLAAERLPDYLQLQLTDGRTEWRLNITSKYYQQIQGEIHAVDVKWCDLIVWTDVDQLILRIDRDDSWARAVLSVLENTYREHLKPPNWHNLDIEIPYDPTSFTGNVLLFIHPPLYFFTPNCSYCCAMN